MRKFTTELRELFGRIDLLTLNRFNQKQKLATQLYSSKSDRRHENNGERWFHTLPETGEGHLAISLYQFELERAKAIVVA